MRRTLLLLLVVLVTAVTVTDRFWCPDGCLDTREEAAGHGHSEPGGTCLICAQGIHPGPPRLPLVVVQLTGDSGSAPAQRIPMTPPRPIDHPPA